MKTDAELMNDFFETNHYEPTVDWRTHPTKGLGKLAKYSEDQPRDITKADASDEERDDHGRWTSGAQSGAYKQTKDAYTGPYPVDDKGEGLGYDSPEGIAFRQRESDWKTSTKMALTEGDTTEAEAKTKGFYSDGGGKYGALPPTLFHVTTSANAIQTGGIKTRDEHGTNAGIGGGTSDTISLTSDLKTAEDYHSGLLEAHDLMNGKITVAGMMQDAKNGTLTNGKDFSGTVTNMYAREGNELDGKPQGLYDAENGTKTWYVGKYALAPENEGRREMLLEMSGNGEANQGTKVVNGEFLQRPATGEEQLRQKAEFLQRYQFMRESAGGPAAPAFFTNDWEAFKAKPQSDMRLMQFDTKPGSQGYYLPGEHEWRVHSGHVLRLNSVLKIARDTLNKYSPDQPREPDGKFGEGDGGSEKTVVYRLGWAGEKQDAEKGTGSFAGDAARVASHINYTEEADKAAGDTIFAYEVPKVTEWIKQRQGNTIMLTDKAKLIGSVPLSDVYEKAKAGMFDVAGTHIESLFSDHAVKKYSPDQARDDHGRFGSGDASSDKTVTVFHGTAAAYVADVIKNGLLPVKSSRVALGENRRDKSLYRGIRGESVYVTPHADDALKYATATASAHRESLPPDQRLVDSTQQYLFGDKRYPLANKTPLVETAILHFEVPKSVADKFKIDEHDNINSTIRNSNGRLAPRGGFRIESGSLSAKYLKGYDLITKDEYGEDIHSRKYISLSKVDGGETATVYAVVFFSQKSADDVKKYSEDQPRDDHGRFGSGGTPMTAPADGGDAKGTYAENHTHQMWKRDIVKTAAEQVAKKMGFDKSKIEYYASEYKFMLNGKECTAGGTATLDKGTIQLYLPAISDTAPAWSTKYIMTHEIGHQIYQSVLNEKKVEDQGVFNHGRVEVDRGEDASPRIREMPALTNDGVMRDHPVLNEKFPVSADIAKYDTSAMKEKLHDEDGISDYSREWWQAYDNKTATYKQAMHETFAEITRTVYDNKDNGLSKWEKDSAAAVTKPLWRKYFSDVNSAYNKMRKSKKS